MAKKEKEETLTIAEMRDFAKELGVKVKGKTADVLKEDILDAIEEEVKKAKEEKQGKKWAKDHKHLVDFYNKFVEDDNGSGSDDLKKTKEKVTKAKEKAKKDRKERKPRKSKTKEKKKTTAKKAPSRKKSEKKAADTRKKAKGEPSNKLIIYKEWKKKKGKVDAPTLSKLVKGAVKESTIKSWTNRWPKGKGLPAGA